MHKLLMSTLAAGALVVGGGTAFAHHSFAAEYDSNRPAHLEGTVTKVEWGNPHSYLEVKGRADSGKEEHFRIELGGRKALETKGWARRTVKAGDIVTVDGWYGRDNHAHINAKTVHVNHDKRDFDAASSYFSTAAAGN